LAALLGFVEFPASQHRSLGSPDGGFIIASPGARVVRTVPTTLFYFIPSAITGFIANIFPSRNRVSPNEAFEVLEPDDGKLSCPVLRGLGDRKVVQLLGSLLLSNAEPAQGSYKPASPPTSFSNQHIRNQQALVSFPEGLS
jgi:hypothetical protein